MNQQTLKNMMKLAFPVMIATILQVLLGSVDLFFISKFGRESSSAAAMGGGMSGAIFIFSMLISSGLTPIVSQNYGANRFNWLKQYAKRGMLYAVILGGIIMVLAKLFNEQILLFMYQPTGDVLKLTVKYLDIIYLSTIFVFLNGTMRSVFHALSDTITPLLVMGASNLLNGFLDYIFVLKFGWGIEGAAVATVISIVLSTICLYVFYRKKIRNLKDTKEQEPIQSRQIFKIGFWAMLQQLARPITGMIMYRIVFQIGQSIGTAAFGIGGQVLSYTFIFLSGLSVAISVMTGQAYGEQKYDEISGIMKSGFVLATLNILIFMIPYFLFSENLMKWFIDDMLVVKEGVHYLTIVYLGIIGIPISTVLGGAYLGMGKTAYPFWASFTANVLFKVPLAYIIGVHYQMGTTGVWVAISLSIWLESLIMGIHYLVKRKEIFRVSKNAIS